MGTGLSSYFLVHLEITRLIERRFSFLFSPLFLKGNLAAGFQLLQFFLNKKVLLVVALLGCKFIGIDQTRGWFYTLMVLSTALFDRPPFKNLICNGLVLAADGSKMSKRKKNYPDPLKVGC